MWPVSIVCIQSYMLETHFWRRYTTRGYGWTVGAQQGDFRDIVGCVDHTTLLQGLITALYILYISFCHCYLKISRHSLYLNVFYTFLHIILGTGPGIIQSLIFSLVIRTFTLNPMMLQERFSLSYFTEMLLLTCQNGTFYKYSPCLYAFRRVAEQKC